MAGAAYSFRTRHTWVLGDFNAAQAPDASYRLPYRDGLAFRIGQAPGGPISTHTTPDSRYAVDIGMPLGAPSPPPSAPDTGKAARTFPMRGYRPAGARRWRARANPSPERQSNWNCRIDAAWRRRQRFPIVDRR